MSDSDREQLISLLEPYAQQHLLAFWDELSHAERQQLTEQIRSVDLGQINSLYLGNKEQPDWDTLSRKATPPPAVRLSERSVPGTGICREAIERGELALRTGRMGVLLTAGGQGSRLGFEKPKSMFPIGPVSQASLLQIHIEKLRSLARRYGVAIPLYLMTSPATHQATVEFLQQNHRFGLAKADLFVFCQGTMPAVDIETGKLLLAEKHQLFLSPDGHGGTVAALQSTGALQHMKSHGIEQLFYLQVDNPLVPIGDPELIGHHLLAESELTSIAVAKQHPLDKVGNFAMIDGNMHVIEYSDLPDEVAEQQNSDRSLKFWAGSIAVHIFARSILERALSVADTLPFHIARKKVPHVNAAGEQVNPAEPNALKFERFIFDLLPSAERPLVVEYAEAECFAPLKNASGAPKDTPEYVREMLLAQHRRWLEAAGAQLAPGVAVEISPLFALDARDVTQRIPAGQQFMENQYLAVD